MCQGHDYENLQKNFDCGRTFIVVDLKTKKVKWNHTGKEFMDSRGVCMRNGQLFYHCPQKFLTGLNVATGESAWRNL